MRLITGFEVIHSRFFKTLKRYVKVRMFFQMCFKFDYARSLFQKAFKIYETGDRLCYVADKRQGY